MLAILITAPTMAESRSQQDAVVEFLADDGIAPVMWLIFIAIRTPVSVVAFSNRYVGKLADSDFDFVLTDEPMAEAMRRAKY